MTELEGFINNSQRVKKSETRFHAFLIHSKSVMYFSGRQ